MKKSLFLSMFAATGMLLAISCSNDELTAVQPADEVQVSFALGLEGGIGSRAISDGTGADKLVYAVYKVNAKTGVSELQNVEGSTNGQFVKPDFKSGDNVSITLAKGQTYQVAFWAQDGDCNAYGTSDLTNVTVDYQGVNNDELRDAFYKTVEFTVSANKTIDVVLKRPFAQINVGVYKSDWEAAVASGITIEKSSVTIKDAATSINLLTGAVGNQEDVEVNYSSELIPNEELKVDLNQDGDFDDENEKYAWLSMSYILVADHDEAKDNNGLLGTDRTTLAGLEYTFTPAEGGNAIVFKDGLAGAPVQRNWRTNILGKLLTGDIQFNITIDPVYDGDIKYPGTSTEELGMAVIYGGTVNATENIDLGQNYLSVQSDLILNMNGNTLNVAEGQVSGYGALLTNGATAEFNDANIVSGGAGINVQSGADVVFNSGSIHLNSDTNSGERYVFYATQKGTTVTINGGTFSFANVYRKIAYICANSNAKVYVTGGEFGAPCQHPNWKEPIVEANGGEVIITGGTFGFDPSKWVAEGYVAVKNANNTYTVTVKPSVEALNAALENAIAGSTIVLSNEAVDYGTITINELKDITIEGNENASIIFNTDADTKIENVTIQNFDFEYTGSNANCGFVINSEAQIDNLVIDNCTFTGTGAKAGRGIYGQNTSATIVLKDCTFKNLDYPIYTMAAGGYESLTVENCTFENIISWAIMTQYNPYTGDLTVNGCNFVNCVGGLVRTGNFTEGHTFTFTNNTVTNSQEHPAKNWFQINASEATKVISGNTKDGASWTPGTEEGLN